MKLPLTKEELDFLEHHTTGKSLTSLAINDLLAQSRLAIDLKEMLDYMLSTHDFDCIEELREQQIEAKMKEYNKERLKEES